LPVDHSLRVPLYGQASVAFRTSFITGDNIMAVENLAQLAQQIEEKYGGLSSFVVSAQQIRLTEAGLLSTGKNQFRLTIEGSAQFARGSKIPVRFFLGLPPDLQAVLFNRLFQVNFATGSAIDDIRINLNKEQQVIGYDDPRLLKIAPSKLMGVVVSSLPQGLSTEQIRVSRLHLSATIVSFSCFSPDIKTQPRVDDIVEAGIDIHHSTTGEFGTQVRCYLRCQVCSNGASAHICQDEKQARARRLPNGRFDEQDMLDQLRRLLVQGWAQRGEKLDAVKSLLDKPGVSIDFLRQQRAKFSLNNRVLEEIEVAMDQDELGKTGTQYDLFNAISRVASHDLALSLRQQRRMMFMAGEFSQQAVRRCPQCGSWLVKSN